MNLATRLDSFQHADAVDHPSSHRPLKFQCHWNKSKINRNLLTCWLLRNNHVTARHFPLIICPRSEYCRSWKHAWVLAFEHGKANHYTSKLRNQKKLFEMLQSMQGTKWHPVNPESQPSFTIFLRVPTEFIQCHHTEDLPFAGAISAAARRNGCSEQVSEQFSTQKAQRSDFFRVSYLENWGKLKNNVWNFAMSNQKVRLGLVCSACLEKKTEAPDPSHPRREENNPGVTSAQCKLDFLQLPMH